MTRKDKIKEIINYETNLGNHEELIKEFKWLIEMISDDEVNYIYIEYMRNYQINEVLR